MVNLRNQQSEFESGNVQSVVVVMATPEQTQPVVEKLQLSYTVLCDPDQIAYRSFEIPQGTPWQYLGPRIWLAGLRAMLRGGMGKPLNDITQMHGTVLVNSIGEVIFRHHGKHSADYTQISDVLAATDDSQR